MQTEFYGDRCHNRAIRDLQLETRKTDRKAEMEMCKGFGGK